MKILKSALILTAITFFIIACTQNHVPGPDVAEKTPDVGNVDGNSQAAPTPGDHLATARKIYSGQCINCHKEDGSGGVSEIDGVKIKAPNFRSEKMKKDSDKDWIEAIENGEKSDGMPAFKGKISDEDIRNLVKLIRHDFQGKKDN
jgi:mono/diheme cytochrome c family protein